MVNKKNTNSKISNIFSESDSDFHIAVNPKNFEAALNEMRSIIGDEYVYTEGKEFEYIIKATIPNPKRPSALVRPSTSEEVSEIVRIAEKYQIPLWPVSKGKNWGYGSATPVLENTLVMKLDRLNSIIEVNEELAYAVVEPGVTFLQLRTYLDTHYPELWNDSTDGPAEGSVIGNSLDRGLGVTHYSDHFGVLCGLEVVLPNGEIMRTGGGPDDCKTWNTHKWGVGPYTEGLFSQSNLGIVTKAGVWLMKKPEKFISFTFDLRHEEDLPKLIDAIRDLTLRNILNSACHFANDIVTLSILSQYPQDLLSTHSRIPEDVLEKLRKQYGISKWIFGGGIQGTKEQVKIVKKELRKKVSKFGRIMFVNDRLIALTKKVSIVGRWPIIGAVVAFGVKTITGKSMPMLDAAPHIHSVLKGIPSDYFVKHSYFKGKYPRPEISDPSGDDCGLIWFAPVAPMTGKSIDEVMSICKPLFKKYDFDFYAALLIQNARSMIVLMSIFYRKDDAEQVEKAQELYEALNEEIAQAGYQTYRKGVGSMKHMRKTSPTFVKFAQNIKKGVDPKGIIAPGKYGI